MTCPLHQWCYEILVVSWMLFGSWTRVNSLYLSKHSISTPAAFGTAIYAYLYHDNVISSQTNQKCNYKKWSGRLVCLPNYWAMRNYHVWKQRYYESSLSVLMELTHHTESVGYSAVWEWECRICGSYFFCRGMLSHVATIGCHVVKPDMNPQASRKLYINIVISYFTNGPAVASDNENSSCMALTCCRHRNIDAVRLLPTLGVVRLWTPMMTRQIGCQLTTVKTTDWKCCASLTRLSMVYGFLGQKWLDPAVQ